MDELDLAAFGLKTSDFDLNSLLNDKDLLKDLHSLGWSEPSSAHQSQSLPQPPPVAGTISNSQRQPQQQQQSMPVITQSLPNVEPLLDISHLLQDHKDIENFDEHTLNEEELHNDEELLQEYAVLAGTSTVTTTSTLTTTTKVQPSSAPTIATSNNSSARGPSSTMVTSSATTTTIANTPNPQSVTSIEEAKRLACKFKRDGDTDEALKWFRHAKKLEQQQQQVSSSRSSASVVTSTAAVNGGNMVNNKSSNLPAQSVPLRPTPGSKEAIQQQFNNLESALMEASNLALNQAKEAKSQGDNKLAIEFMKEYKKYEQEIAVLRTRILLPGSTAPLFQWQSTQRQVKVEHLEIGENDMKVDIEAIHGLETVLESHSSRSISVRINYGGGEDAMAITTPSFKYLNDTKSVSCPFSTTLTGIVKRGKVGQTSFLRKKLTLDIILHRGFFRSDIVIAQSIISFQELGEKSSYSGKMPIYAVDEKGEKKGKALGGWMKASIQLRTPLLKPELQVHEERKLIVQPWPELIVSSPTAIDTSSQSTSTSTNVVPSTTSAPVQEKASSVPTFELTELEKSDPESVDLLVSNDVLTAEITRVEEILKSQAATMDDLEVVQMNTRLQLLQIKMQILEQKVISEELSMEQYLEMVKERLQRDQHIALYFKNQNTKRSTSLALTLMKRIKIMKEEISNAEAAMNQEEKEEV